MVNENVYPVKQSKKRCKANRSFERKHNKVSNLYDNYVELANAIIVQACNDYRSALAIYDKPSMDSIERFFASEWAQLLTNADLDEIARKIRKEYGYK